ncbi:MAG TPA: ABC transporter substrate-binding protein [Azonexus sp.]
MLRKHLLWLLLLLLLPGFVRADSGSPDELVKNVTTEVLNILREDKGIQAGNRQKAISLIETKVAPHFDFARMTSLAVGRAWQQADAGQRQALTGEFRTLLINTYANSLTAYRDQTVSFKPSPKGSGDEVTVRSQIERPGSKPISLNYSLARGGDGWKVFDVVIADISLVTNYRSSFATEVDKGGIAGLLKALQDRNRRLDTAKSPA